VAQRRLGQRWEANVDLLQDQEHKDRRAAHALGLLHISLRPRRLLWHPQGLGPAFGSGFNARQFRYQVLASYFQGKKRLEARQDLPVYAENAVKKTLAQVRSQERLDQRALAPAKLATPALTTVLD
jgi:hypothetical protein